MDHLTRVDFSMCSICVQRGKHIVEGLCICCEAIKWIKGD